MRKSRFFPLASVGTTLLIVAGAGWYAGQTALETYTRAAEQRAAQDQEQEIPDTDDELLAEMERLYPLIGGISRPDRATLAGDVHYELFGFDEEAVRTREEEAREFADPAARFEEHVVSMTFVSPRESYAVIDGELYRVGDSLRESEGRIRTITPDRVLIAGRRARQWVEVSNMEDAPEIHIPEVDLAGGRTPETAAEERRRAEAGDEPSAEMQELMQGVEILRSLGNQR